MLTCLLFCFFVVVYVFLCVRVCESVCVHVFVLVCVFVWCVFCVLCLCLWLCLCLCVYVSVCFCVCAFVCVCWPAGPCARAEFSFGVKQHVCRAIGSQHVCMEAMPQLCSQSVLRLGVVCTGPQARHMYVWKQGRRLAPPTLCINNGVQGHKPAACMRGSRAVGSLHQHCALTMASLSVRLLCLHCSWLAYAAILGFIDRVHLQVHISPVVFLDHAYGRDWCLGILCCPRRLWDWRSTAALSGILAEGVRE